MGEKKKKKKQTKKSEQSQNHTHKWICLFANKIQFSSFHWLVVLIELLLLFHSSLSALHVHWEEY